MVLEFSLLKKWMFFCFIFFSLLIEKCVKTCMYEERKRDNFLKDFEKKK